MELKYKCTLLSDVILNQKAASEGPNKTLDFIPGSCFLGIVASKYDSFDKEIAMEIFHSGEVRFGDAHPSEGNLRGLRIPACFYYPKLGKMEDECYVHYRIPDLDSEKVKQKQLKQCRSGFYVFDGMRSKEVATYKSFAIKSAYDRVCRRSKDKQMFGYESLQKGLELFFSVEIDNPKLKDIINKNLKGLHYVGRSRTAQYGLVNIEETEFDNLSSVAVNDDLVSIYADGRLIFLDENGNPTFQPFSQDLGLDGAEIIWEKSQIRTFQYAPWNYKRQCFDTDRCGIEKGSVIVVDVSKSKNFDLSSRYVGSYNNEGFGKVIFNPSFLDFDPNDGRAKVVFDKDSNDKNTSNVITFCNVNSPLVAYLTHQRDCENKILAVYQKVNEWVLNFQYIFSNDLFASQWGQIRDIVSQTNTKSAIQEQLEDYLGHGIAKEKWEKMHRKEKLMDFLSDFEDDESARLAVINLASEMAKKCKEK